MLAYSGGLDTSVAVDWLQRKNGYDVVTLTLDVGQADDLDQIESKSKRVGAVAHYTLDVKREFAEDYVFPAVKANALYESKYPVSTALARPLIARKLVDIAHREGAVGIAHGCTGKGNDQVRFEVAVKSFDPSLKIIAPAREWGLSREEEIKYAHDHGIPVPADLSNPYSVDQNLWGRSVECGVLEDPQAEPPPEAYEWTTPPERTPDTPEYVTIQFDNGVPVGLNGKHLGPVEIIRDLNFIGGRHSVGRIDHIEDRLVLIEAHRELEKMVLTRHELEFKHSVDVEWARLAYTGLWTDPLREALDSFIDKTQERVTGEVKLKIFKGTVQVVGRASPFSLYENRLATYSSMSTFDQSWSEGFIEIWAMPTVLANSQKRAAQSRIFEKRREEKPATA